MGLQRELVQRQLAKLSHGEEMPGEGFSAVSQDKWRDALSNSEARIEDAVIALEERFGFLWTAIRAMIPDDDLPHARTIRANDVNGISPGTTCISCNRPYKMKPHHALLRQFEQLPQRPRIAQ